ncbi:peptidoglycan editing factor PgeF [Marinimicrobium sp. ABcell2]|uniref:peptidoglycan editing factor PgeF n=1 Tax=Marinimicrobium sp. ABcell2 TaxID=3069751 RepID=UPI0027B16A25|nr:peptidoglycan editing factor PgeF [Marinimicrobium sp. ABcell2]MDQ2078114.1 peptidoglycan editing factor PgeF [Marinimicrobium sp. ABcell2]
MTLILPDWPAPANVRAAITTRSGGQSHGPYASNNLAFHVEDDERAVVANRERLRAQLALPEDPQWLTQVHGTKVPAARADGRVRTADGCYSRTPGLACAVLTADCLPLLLCNRTGTQVAAVHAGWRGLAKGVVKRAVSRFDDRPQDLLVYLGPAISREYFEVGVEVLEAFFRSARNQAHSDRIAASFSPGVRPLHFFADLYALARAELSALGVTQIYGGDYCTYADSERFYSYRRDRVTGRMASLIWLAP